jgi:hypothetical protein
VNGAEFGERAEHATHRARLPLIGKSLCGAPRAHILKPILDPIPSLILSLSMRRTVAICVILASTCVQAAGAPRNSWNKIRYRGGTVAAKVDDWDWNTTLTVKADEIVVVFAPRTTVRIKPSQVDSISYGVEAHRRVGDIVALSVVLGPFALFGLLRHPQDHLVGIVYHTDDGKRCALLLETPIYMPILQALKTATGKPVDFSP